MTLYIYRCPVHGEVEVRKPMQDATRTEYCWPCLEARLQADGAAHPGECRRIVYDGLEMTRVYTPPVTNLASFGRNLMPASTPQWQWRPRSDLEARQLRDIARRDGNRTQFGAGQSTGS